MSNDVKIKKRRGKKSKKVIVIVSLVIFLLIVGGVFVFIKKDELFSNKNNLIADDFSKDTQEDNDKYIDLDIDDINIRRLYDLVHSSKDSTIYSNGKLSVDDMDDFYRFSLAYNLYGDEIIVDEETSDGIKVKIDEELVKSAYDEIFGKGSYKQIENIPGNCNILYYDAVFKRYIATDTLDCDVTSSFITKEKIVSAQKNSTTLKISSVVLHYSSSTNTICKDYNCENVLENYYSFNDIDEYLENYLNNNLEQLQEYTYYFKLDTSGNYIYQGFERTKE